MGKILLENGTGMSGLGRMGAAQLIAFPAKLAVQGPRSPLGVGGGEDGLQTAGLDPAKRGEEPVQLSIGEMAEDQHRLRKRLSGDRGLLLSRKSLGQDGEGTVQVALRHPTQRKALNGAERREL